MRCGGPPCGASNSRHVNCDVRAPHLSCSFRYLRVTSWNGSYIVSCSAPCGEETNTPEVTGAREVTVNGRSSPRATEPRRCRCRQRPPRPNSAQSRKARPPRLCSTLVARAAVAPTRLTPHTLPPLRVARLSQLPWRPLARRPPPAARPSRPLPPRSQPVCTATCLSVTGGSPRGAREVALCKAPARPLTRLTTHPIDPMPYLHRPFLPLQPLGETTGRG